MDFKDYVKKEYNRQAAMQQKYQEILDVLSRDKARLVLDRGEYYIIDETGRHYANRSMCKRVERMKLKKLLEKAVKRLNGNTKALRKMLKEYEPCDYDSLNGLVSEAYKGAFLPAAPANWRNEIPPFTQSENPLYPEELIHTTSFGLKVRTKGEMEVAELLYKLGIPFRYEMRVELQDDDGTCKVMYPDFSIPLEREWFFIEHLGLLNKPGYVKRNIEKLHTYHSNGILMPGQIIFTMDGPDGGLDAGPVKEFLEKIILPKIWMAEAAEAAAC